MTRRRGPGVVVYRRTGGPDDIDAIDQYSRRLVTALAGCGTPCRYEPHGLGPVVAEASRPAWVLLQYNPFRFGRWGFAPALIRDAWRLRRRGIPVALMVHEAWVPVENVRWALLTLWQRAQLRALVALADVVMTSTEGVARALGRDAVHLPVATNIVPAPVSREDARGKLGLDGRLTVVLFGRGHESRALDHSAAAIAELARVHGSDRLAVLNLGDGAPRPDVPGGVALISPGRQPEAELSRTIAAGDVALLPLRDGLSTRRSTLMAALAHGLPVVALRGASTDRVLLECDALTLTPAGRPEAFARAAASLTLDSARMAARAAGGRRLYEEEFDWPVLAERVQSVLDRITVVPAKATRKITFVALDVGDYGGMERQSARLMRGLLAAGWRVRIIARTCDLPAHPNLRFVRVRTPRRPAALAYPAFIAAASALAMRPRTALLHVTGAMHVGRADLCTVHYCHRAAAREFDGSRARRASRLYRLNSAVHGMMSRSAESWCYRPERTALLCAVSPGVAAELHTCFPAMAHHIRVVPNGVDCDAFAPDRSARTSVRTKLGIPDSARLALFVGGDWDRKGLQYAVDALPNAPGWQLVVAGEGDPDPYVTRARAAGFEDRVQFLGAVRDTPPLYAAADAFVLPSAYETFSLVTFEAAASGVPLLVTPVSGVVDLLEDGANGWFITRDADDVAQRLRTLAADPEQAARMGQAARVAASRYSWEAMTAGYLAVYGELQDRRRSEAQEHALE